MKRILVLATVVVLATTWIGCSRVADPEPTPADPAVDTEQLAAEIVRGLNWPVDADQTLPPPDKARPNAMLQFDREVLVDDIAHYSILIQVGDHPHDRIGLHRVVREAEPWVPERSRHSVMMLHGDGAPFVTAFLMSALSDAIADDHAIPIYMAERGVDVWGIDLAWTNVPVDVPDTDFLADWGVQKDIDDLGVALGTARVVRRLTGNGWRKMHLLGWSRGVWNGFAYLNEESQRPPGHRHVKGFIPVDGYYVVDDPIIEEFECTTVADLQAAYAGGYYADDSGVFLDAVAAAARTAPGDPFPDTPYTNLQFALAVGTESYQLFGYPWTYHIVAGTYDEAGLPDGLQYTPVELWLDFMQNWAPYQPILGWIETSAISCDDPAYDVPWDDHLGDITVPILYVGAAGGFGDRCAYTLSVIGSSDVSSLVIQLHPDEEAALDFGHADIFMGENADELIWPTVTDWVLERGNNSGRGKLEVSTP